MYTPFVEQKTILVASRLFHKSGWLTSSKLYRDNLMILHNKRLWPSKCRESLNPAAHLTFCTMDCLFTSIFYKRRNHSKRPRCLCRINWSITRSRRRSIVKLDLLKSHTHSPPSPTPPLHQQKTKLLRNKNIYSNQTLRDGLFDFQPHWIYIVCLRPLTTSSSTGVLLFTMPSSLIKRPIYLSPHHYPF